MPAVKADGLWFMARLLIAKGAESEWRYGPSASLLFRRAGSSVEKGSRGKSWYWGIRIRSSFRCFARYGLTQTVVDYAYAVLLNRYGRKLSVHIGVDTGMHRLGERCEKAG